LLKGYIVEIKVIDFKATQWDRVAQINRLWWEHRLDRPIIPIAFIKEQGDRPCPDAPILSQDNWNDFSITPEAFVDRLDYEYSKRIFAGDSFPYLNLHCFGPGVAAAFLGAIVDTHTGLTWFHPECDVEVTELNFEYDPKNIYLKRVKDICRAAVDRWGSDVLVSMPDLGGNLDMLSTFRPSEKLLLDLYDYPEKVKELTWKLHDLWHIFYAEIGEILWSANPLYTDWSSIVSDTPSYVLQCDFCYMIGPEMFDEFVRPELALTCKKLDRTIYHLDGPGQLPHLDSLLEIEDLDAVQWVPGEGSPDAAHWPQVFRKIRDAGKNIQIINNTIDFDAYDAVIEQLGSGKGVHIRYFELPIEYEDAVMNWLAKYGIN
jgi:hypothetical protein